MRIGVDGRAFSGNITGVGRYIIELCKELARILPKTEFIVYSNQLIELPESLRSWSVHLDTRRFSRDLKPVLWLKTRCGALCNNDKLDSFWGGAAFLPSLRPYVNSVLTVHDLTYNVLPSSMSLFHRLSFIAFFRNDVLKATNITVNSQSTAKRLTQLIGRNADAVIYPAVNPKFNSNAIYRLPLILQKYSIKSPYFLAASTLEPRKNIENLIYAFLRLKHENNLTQEKLVLVGGRGWKDDRIFTLANSDNNILHLGYIPDEDLATLYSGALAFIFPSIYEGFGIPVIEARACGATIITTDIPELHESGGIDAIYIRPNINELMKAMLNVAISPKRLFAKDPNLPSWATGGKVLANLLEKRKI